MPVSSNSLVTAEHFWNTAAETYEQDFSGTSVGKIRREAVWHVLRRTFNRGQHILELSCGTGLDAVMLAQRGVHVLACDISPRMIELAKAHANGVVLPAPPQFRVLATEQISTLAMDAPFDGAFSNFSGLNCIADLQLVAEDLGRLLKPGAPLVICMMGRFVPLEILWFLAQGKSRKAFRRLLPISTDHLANTGLVIQRPTVAQIEASMHLSFRLVRWKGIGIVVPASYAESSMRRFPKLIQSLAAVDRHIGQAPFLRHMADCVVLEFENASSDSTS